MDVRYSHDGLHRLLKAETGKAGSGGSFTVAGLVDNWSAMGLSQTRNWNGAGGPGWRGPSTPARSGTLTPSGSAVQCAAVRGRARELA